MNDLIGKRFNDNMFSDSIVENVSSNIENNMNKLHSINEDLTKATTIVSIYYKDGVIIAGDKRATAGNYIMNSDITKIFLVDSNSAIGVCGVVGIAMEMMRVLKLDLLHYSKIENQELSPLGKVNRLKSIITSNFPYALSGLVALPIYVLSDTHSHRSYIYSFDITGEPTYENEFSTVGSGSIIIKGFLDKKYNKDASLEDGITLLTEALLLASKYDSATSPVSMDRLIKPDIIAFDNNGIVDSNKIQSILDESLNTLLK